jgi:hypothetical protein
MGFATHDCIVATQKVVSGGIVLVAGGFAGAGVAGVGTVFAKTVRPTVVHGDTAWRRSHGIGGRQGGRGRSGRWRLMCAIGGIGAMVACSFGSDFASSFFTGFCDVGDKIGHCPAGIIKVTSFVFFSGDHTGVFKNREDEAEDSFIRDRVFTCTGVTLNFGNAKPEIFKWRVGVPLGREKGTISFKLFAGDFEVGGFEVLKNFMAWYVCKSKVNIC